MLTVVANAENSETIVLPQDELEKLGIAAGDEVELLKQNGEIVLRPKRNERTQKILEKTKEIIERRKSALIELGKGHE
ncbi:MAG TPA: AbrB/MazE/SpoVT family DNA-binding domain-containing protein [Pyrinomonadaceae bacterium]|nr:AbrB/MazE/SpoVT family DNA-binding domain-containing protein [Pyrinomonadaceae bacterium]